LSDLARRHQVARVLHPFGRRERRCRDHHGLLEALDVGQRDVDRHLQARAHRDVLALEGRLPGRDHLEPVRSTSPIANSPRSSLTAHWPVAVTQTATSGVRAPSALTTTPRTEPTPAVFWASSGA
jgi:hypothetical protein